MTTPGDPTPAANDPSAAPKLATAPATVIGPLIGKQLASAVLVAGVGTAGAAAIVIRFTGGDASWWAGYRAASAVMVLAVLGSLYVIRQAVGRPLMVLPAMVMLLSAVRLGICLAGLIVAVKIYKAPPEPSGVIICGYYAVLLGVESFVIHRALGPKRPGAMKVEGNIKP